jgi:hypothetical protein
LLKHRLLDGTLFLQEHFERAQSSPGAFFVEVLQQLELNLLFRWELKAGCPVFICCPRNCDTTFTAEKTVDETLPVSFRLVRCVVSEWNDSR